MSEEAPMNEEREEIIEEQSERMRGQTPEMDEGEESDGMFRGSGGASVTKKELFRIIEDQDEAIEALRREVDALKRSERMTPSPTKKRERMEETESESGCLRRPSLWRPRDHGGPDASGWNGGISGRLSRHCPVRQPLARCILSEPAGTNIPSLPAYDGTRDPEDHLNGYFTKMQLYNSTDATLCKVFPSTFSSVVLDWHHQIKEGRIDCFEQFAAMFLAKFASRKRRSLTIGTLFKVRQKEGEALREFYERWLSVALEVKDAQPSVLGVCLNECTSSEELCR
ncbi:unnamed protein product [Linum trigynum]|uniref:Retrotransposon gag domain-containing protein n=1 Tax=Linum trigynum TaxID=586398 RepID=A0AAV2GM09_9ROSI